MCIIREAGSAMAENLELSFRRLEIGLRSWALEFGGCGRCESVDTGDEVGDPIVDGKALLDICDRFHEIASSLLVHDVVFAFKRWHRC